MRNCGVFFGGIGIGIGIRFIFWNWSESELVPEPRITQSSTSVSNLLLQIMHGSQTVRLWLPLLYIISSLNYENAL